MRIPKAPPSKAKSLLSSQRYPTGSASTEMEYHALPSRPPSSSTNQSPRIPGLAVRRLATGHHRGLQMSSGSQVAGWPAGHVRTWIRAANRTSSSGGTSPPVRRIVAVRVPVDKSAVTTSTPKVGVGIPPSPEFRSPHAAQSKATNKPIDFSLAIRAPFVLSIYASPKISALKRECAVDANLTVRHPIGKLYYDRSRRSDVHAEECNAFGRRQVLRLRCRRLPQLAHRSGAGHLGESDLTKNCRRQTFREVDHYDYLIWPFSRKPHAP